MDGVVQTGVGSATGGTRGGSWDATAGHEASHVAAGRWETAGGVGRRQLAAGRNKRR